MNHVRMTQKPDRQSIQGGAPLPVNEYARRLARPPVGRSIKVLASYWSKIVCSARQSGGPPTALICVLEAITNICQLGENQFYFEQVNEHA